MPTEEKKEFVVPTRLKTTRRFHYQETEDGTRLVFSLDNDANQLAEFLGYLKVATVDVQAFLDSTVSGDNVQR